LRWTEEHDLADMVPEGIDDVDKIAERSRQLNKFLSLPTDDYL
jgi:hypothetical protein